MAQPSIFAIIVLYRQSPEESESFVSLRTILQERPDLASSMRLLVYDNSPTTHEVPASPVEMRYISNTSNAGLARAYNTALKLALDEGMQWLLLLDQDTVLTESYLSEAIALAHTDDRFEAIVPKLAEAGIVLSPHYPLTLRHPKPLDIAAYGILSEEIHPYNSGAILKVKALQKMDGFPDEFPIDYLDHATFRILQTNGGRIFVMQAVLEHQLSSNSRHRAVSSREKNTLQAEHRFYQRYGSRQEQFYYHVRLIWRAWKALGDGSPERGYLLLKTVFTNWPDFK